METRGNGSNPCHGRRYRNLLVFLAGTALLCMFALPAPPLIGKGGERIEPGGFRVITRAEERRSRASFPLTSGSRDGRVSVKIHVPETGYDEWLEYLLPPGYDPAGPPYPMIVCWHGYGQSHLSVAIDSLIDEECQSRGWIFLSVLGHIETNFGYPIAQIHCTAAIRYMVEDIHINVDKERIYMAGYSMGGGAAASYACRHLAPGEGYPVAGLVLVAAVMDWTYAYDQGDPGVVYWLPILLGGTPADIPFAYKQISALHMAGGSYQVDASMGQNFRQGLPVFVTYAQDDPLGYDVKVNQTFVQMLQDLGADVMVDYYPMGTTPYPHDWKLLDVPAAFDFLEGHTLKDQDTASLNLLADRDGTFYWTEVVQHQGEAFSRVRAEAHGPADNTVHVLEASNTDTLRVDCDWTGLHAGDDLYVTFLSTEPYDQALELLPIPSNPTYVVDASGQVMKGYSYAPTNQTIHFSCPAGTSLDLKVSFEPYLLSLVTADQVKINQVYTADMSGGSPFDPYLLFFAFTQQETKIGSHHLLVYPFSPTVWVLDTLDGTGSRVFPVHVPNDPTLYGLTVYHQFLTYHTAIEAISNLSATQIVQ